MIKDLISRIKMKWSSLYMGLFWNILLGIVIGVTVYVLTQLVSDSYIRLNYASEDKRDEREAQQITELRNYVENNELKLEDVVKVAEWASEKRYLYLMLYDGERLVYTSDLGVIPPEGTIPESSNAVVNSGLTVDHPTNASLRDMASENGRFAISFVDSELYASVYDYSEYMQYDVINIASMVFAFVALAFIIINYFRRIVKRVRRLEADVTIVTHSSMEHKIATRGADEIGRLSENIENMRQAILDNLQREREARDSNTELITAMSHDIRTPLTVLLGYLEMMKNEAAEQPVMKEYIDASERTAMRLKQLSDDMFKYSLAFGDSIEGINMEKYDASLLFEQVLSEHVMLLRENDYTVEVSNGLSELPAGAAVLTDPQNLMRIIDNVFSNVRKYADINRPVRITARQLDRRRVVFECSNTIRTDTYKAESNKIGLKTCERLARIIADSFEYGPEDGLFVCRLVMNVEIEEPSGADSAEASSANAKNIGAVGRALAAFRSFLRRVGARLGLVADDKTDVKGESEGLRRKASKADLGIKPIEAAQSGAEGRTERTYTPAVLTVDALADSANPDAREGEDGERSSDAKCDGVAIEAMIGASAKGEAAAEAMIGAPAKDEATVEAMIGAPANGGAVLGVAEQAGGDPSAK